MSRTRPPVPDTGWEPPKSFPNLSGERVLSVDVETYDPELTEHGPGWARGKGHLVGISIGCGSGGRWYFPIRHEDEPQYNMDPQQVLSWLRFVLDTPNVPKVGANLLYDVGWLRWEGVNVTGSLWDVQFAEALLTENSDTNLEALSQKYLGEGKDSNQLYDWCSRFYGGAPKSNQRKNIYRAPPRLVGPYAESDADLPLRLMSVMYPLLCAEGLEELFCMENRLIPLLIEMRLRGCPVDTGRAEEVRDVIRQRIITEKQSLKTIAGQELNVNAPESIAKAFSREGIPYTKTAKGNASFTKAFLQTVKHPLAESILEVRRLEKLCGVFIESYILGSNVNGVIHCQFHPLRGTEGGTRSGRFSSSVPNLQNIPIRDPELGPLIRSFFVPFDKNHLWRKYDYSQIEYRCLVHYAVGAGADEARQLYLTDPKTDYHEMTLALVAPLAGWDISTPEGHKTWRRPVKNINFGLVYGMGEAKLSGDLGLTRLQGKQLFQAYHRALPFVHQTMSQTQQEASGLGFITTVLGRRSRFDRWESAEWYHKKEPPLSLEAALKRYGSIRRAETHKALNRRLQGSAADMMKVAMLKCHEAGIFNYTGYPLITVHDELDYDDNRQADEAFREMKHIMETCLPLRVPVIADCEIGPNWGNLKDL